MARMTPTATMKRSAAAWTDKDQWRSYLQSAYELALPHRNPYWGSGDGKHPNRQTPGQRKTDAVFDSTLQMSTVRFASRLQSELVPPFIKWGKLTPGPFIPPQLREKTSSQLKLYTDTMFAAIQMSNFDTAANEFFLDLAMGTAVMMVVEGDDEMPVRFVTIPQSQVALEENGWGTVSGLFRQHSMKCRQIVDMWPDADLPGGFDRMVKDSPEKDVDLTEATYWDAKDGIWYYDVMWKGQLPNASRGATHLLVKREYKESPWIATRWIKAAGEVQGRGPVLFALPDAKVLNKVKELVLKNASIAIAGVWTAVDDGVINPNHIRITPGAVIPVGSNGGARGASIQPLKFEGNFDVSQLLGEELANNIKQMMLDDSLPGEEGPVRSATEFIMRQKKLQADIGSPFGRLMTEFIRPLVQKTLYILSKKGVIPMPDGKSIKINGGTVDVQITSPLAQVQNMNDVQTAIQWLQTVQAFGPEALLLGAKVEDMPSWLAEKLGVDPVLVRTKEERSSMQGMGGQMLGMRAMGGGGVPTGAPANDAGAIPIAA